MGLIDKLGQAKDLISLQRQAKQIQKELHDTLIEAEELDGRIRVVFNGEQKVEEVNIDESLLSPSEKRNLESALKNAIASAIARSQQIAAEKMKDIAGKLGLPGM
jgi:DNA-binding YbaB/EbfC family protein